jgi:hypothetical protein
MLLALLLAFRALLLAFRALLLAFLEHAFGFAFGDDKESYLSSRPFKLDGELVVGDLHNAYDPTTPMPPQRL